MNADSWHKRVPLYRQEVEVVGKSGATRQNRTDDPLITNEMLYQLS